jgi:uncharacterized protein YbjT (DUF2867 family)
VRFLRYHAAVERHVRELGIGYTFLRPNLFFQGLLAFSDVPPDMFAGSLQGILPPWQIDGLLEDYAHYRRGEAAAVSPAVCEITGKPATDVRQFAHDYAQAFTA